VADAVKDKQGGALSSKKGSNVQTVTSKLNPVATPVPLKNRPSFTMNNGHDGSLYLASPMDEN
jgi:hypothetical protein